MILYLSEVLLTMKPPAEVFLSFIPLSDRPLGTALGKFSHLHRLAYCCCCCYLLECTALSQLFPVLSICLAHQPLNTGFFSGIWTLLHSHSKTTITNGWLQKRFPYENQEVKVPWGCEWADEHVIIKAHSTSPSWTWQVSTWGLWYPLSVLPTVDHSQFETWCAQDALCPEITAAQHEKVAFYVCVWGGHDVKNTWPTGLSIKHPKSSKAVSKNWILS